mmetsp:Transcript_25869/g.29592  ORF Transcript_25869/g.29592 Transcript_25869/m.29592 type:complete len:279 (-) Transcript_25869:100-936(-)
MTCQEIQLEADRRQMDPEMCSYYSQVTLSSNDPCNCKRRTRPFQESSTGQDCVDPNLPQPCKLCGNGKIIGDPEKTLPSPYRSSCVSFYDLQEEILADGQGGFSAGFCRDLQGLFSNHCQCVSPGTPVTPCLAQLDFDAQCNPSASDDQCCIGGCRYLDIYQKYLCTTNAGDPAPPSSPSPTRGPTLRPTSPPTALPTEDESFNAAPPKFPTASQPAPPTIQSLCTSDDDCDGNICISLGGYGSLCIPRDDPKQSKSITAYRLGGAGNRYGRNRSFHS